MKSKTIIGVHLFICTVIRNQSNIYLPDVNKENVANVSALVKYLFVHGCGALCTDLQKVIKFKLFPFVAF